MKNKNCHLFTIKNLIDQRDSAKIGRAFQEVLEPHDFGYLANATDNDIDIFIACFESEKIKIIEKIFKENHVLIDSKDISEDIISFNFCKEVQLILKNKYDRDIIENFIISNLELDLILDKICDGGMESLNSIERKFLVKF
jgi:hypothetical protein